VIIDGTLNRKAYMIEYMIEYFMVNVIVERLASEGHGASSEGYVKTRENQEKIANIVRI